MTYRTGDRLRGRLSTVFSEYAPRAYEASASAEQRLNELEDRDSARERRQGERTEQMRSKYPNLPEGQ